MGLRAKGLWPHGPYDPMGLWAYGLVVVVVVVVDALADLKQNKIVLVVVVVVVVDTLTDLRQNPMGQSWEALPPLWLWWLLLIPWLISNKTQKPKSFPVIINQNKLKNTGWKSDIQGFLSYKLQNAHWPGQRIDKEAAMGLMGIWSHKPMSKKKVN